jgi:calcium/calmodulin-dependent protein kinase kinase 2
MHGTKLKDLIDKILTKQSEERLQISGIKQHPWITKNGTEPLETIKDSAEDDFEGPTPEDLQDLISQVKEKQVYMIKKKKHNSPVKVPHPCHKDGPRK